MDKKENRNLGFLVSTVAFCLAAFVAVPLRVYQYFTVIEGGTGFFAETNATVYILYGTLAAALICSLASALLYRKEIGYDRTVKVRPAQGALGLLAAASVGFEVYASFTVLQEGTYVDLGDGTGTVAAYILMAQIVFGLLAAVYLLLMGVCCMRGKTDGSAFKILSAAPTAWLMFRLVYRFMTKISFTKVSELTLELFMLAFMLMFFTAYAQLNSKIESKGLDWKIVGYGLPAAVFGLCCFVPRLVMVMVGRPEMLYINGPVTYCDLGLSLYILSIVFTRIGWVGGNADEKEEKAAKEAEEAAEAKESENAE